MNTSSIAEQAGYPVMKPLHHRVALMPGSTGKPMVKAAKVPSLGRAPYICTPSGFGRTTRCFVR